MQKTLDFLHKRCIIIAMTGKHRQNKNCLFIIYGGIFNGKEN